MRQRPLSNRGRLISQPAGTWAPATSITRRTGVNTRSVFFRKGRFELGERSCIVRPHAWLVVIDARIVIGFPPLDEYQRSRLGLKFSDLLIATPKTIHSTSRSDGCSFDNRASGSANVLKVSTKALD